MTERRRVLAVLGATEATDRERLAAEKIGEAVARAGWVVLTGGGRGVMEAASRGAAEAGGPTVGILPGSDEESSRPNPWVQVAVFTGMGAGRNVINVLSGHLCVAIGGRAGTLSEVALASKAGRRVWWLYPWRLEPPEGHQPLPGVREIDDLDDVLDALAEELTG